MATTKKSKLAQDEMKSLLLLMRAHGVHSFEFEGLKVQFDPHVQVAAGVAAMPTTLDDKEAAAENVRALLKELADDDDLNTNWSA